MTNEILKRAIDANEKFTSASHEFVRSVETTIADMENFWLALPSEEIRSVRQQATDAIDRVMR